MNKPTRDLTLSSAIALAISGALVAGVANAQVDAPVAPATSVAPATPVAPNTAPTVNAAPNAAPTTTVAPTVTVPPVSEKPPAPAPKKVLPKPKDK
ncbi:hypothetical protein [uncultured Nevskia sp.]|uniref:hypothetical protein n=1 Tax=uncultured Nevskia sp. TaxID=228950 RepID=UPI0025CC7257|nr:hypothetical protein [uncultured Nevskia sp.]